MPSSPHQILPKRELGLLGNKGGVGGEGKEERNKRRDGEEGVAGYLTQCEVSHITVHSSHYPQKHTQVGVGR